MNSIRVGIALASSVLIWSTGLAARQPVATPVQFEAEDGVTIFGDLYRTDAPLDAGLILLFHQGGSDARSEYGPLAGSLTDRGYHALAIDQRRGGRCWGE